MSKPTSSDLFNAPVIILVNPQLGENIGTVARAMLNFGLHDLRLVAPREGWQKPRAIKAAAGAGALIDRHLPFAKLSDAIADLHYVVASSARVRDMVKPTLSPAEVSEKMVEKIHQQRQKTGILFGGERSGLDNEAISMSDVLCRVPLNPDFSSLNLAQAVLLFGYEYFQRAPAPARESSKKRAVEQIAPASRAELQGFFTHLETALDAAKFLTPPEKRPAMQRNIRNMFHRAALTEQDVRTLRGMINALLLWPDGRENPEMRARVDVLAKGAKKQKKARNM